jgi:hypothetical protein
VADLNAEGVRVQVVVDVLTPDGRFRDAIYLSPTEFEALTDEAIAQLKASRVTAWQAEISAARARKPPEPTREELLLEREGLRARIEEVDTKLSRGR